MKLRHAFLTAALLAASPAHAATYVITYTGTVSNSHNETGEFGTAGSLDGLTFTSVYTLIAPLAGAITIDTGTEAEIYGGSLYPAPSPLSATLTINGVSQVFTGKWSGDAYQANGLPGPLGYDEVYRGVQDRDPTGAGDGAFFYNTMQNDVTSFINDFLSTQDYTAPLTYSLQSGDTSFGNFELSAYTISQSISGTDGPAAPPIQTYTQRAGGNLTAASVTIATATGVPEPATWATMLVGFGFVGSAMRRGQRRTGRYASADSEAQ